MIDFILQLLSALPLLVGLWLMGNKKLLGVLLACIAEVFTTVIGITHGVWNIVLIGAVLFIVQLRNFIKWKRENTKWI